MAEIWQYVQIADTTFWGTNIYHVWFYVAIVSIILFERSPVIKRVIGLYPIFFILALYSPIAYWLIQTYTSGIWQYFARLYSMIPLPVIIGLGTVEFIDFLCNRGKIGIESLEEQQIGVNKKGAALKLILTGGCCALMVFGGTFVYEQDWMKPAQNRNKVPEDAKAICQILHQDEGVTIAVPDSLSSYIRQIDASFITPYGRYVNDLGWNLSQEHPDPVYIMETAGKQACDYIVVYNNEENISRFLANGWSPYKYQGNYLIYTVEKVYQVKKRYNKARQLIEVKTLDEEGKPTQNKNGYYGIKYKYDNAGNRSKETYLDQNDEPMILSGGYSSVEYDYDSISKHVMAKRYFDSKDQPLNYNGYFEIKYSYDDSGKEIKKCFYDDKGNLVLTRLGYAIIEYEYNETGKLMGEKYYDNQGSIIGMVTEDGSEKTGVFLFFDLLTKGVTAQDGGIIKMDTDIPDNSFNLIHFQIFDANTGEYLLSFGAGGNAGRIKGEYVHMLKDGLYYLRLKGNTNLADEYITSLEYLPRGTVLQYSYDIEVLKEKEIVVNNISVKDITYETISSQ